MFLFLPKQLLQYGAIDDVIFASPLLWLRNNAPFFCLQMRHESKLPCRSTIAQPFSFATAERAAVRKCRHGAELDRGQSGASPPSLVLPNSLAGSTVTLSKSDSANGSHPRRRTVTIADSKSNATPPPVRDTWASRMRRAYAHRRILGSLHDDVEQRMRQLSNKEKQLLMRLRMHEKLEDCNSTLAQKLGESDDKAERLRFV